MTRVSHERAAIEALRTRLEELPGVAIRSGFSAENRIGIPGWELVPNQRFQFGDIRFEGPRATVVVEFESAGGLTNLVKYWPLLAVGQFHKRFTLAHVFRLETANDYIAHRRLWRFTVERMREDLKRRGLEWTNHWEARPFTYPAKEIDATELASFIEAVLRRE
jgi:hypothetical protein